MKAEQDPVPDPISVSPPEESQNKPGHSENNNAASVPPMHASRPPSNPLGQVNAARQGKRDPSTPARPVASSMNPESRLNPDILDRLKNFNLSRQQPQRGSPNLPHTVSTGSVPASKSSDLAPNLTAARNPSSPALGGAMAARLPRRANPPMPGSAAAPTPQRPGSLAAKRAKPGLKLSDAGGSLGGAAGGPPGAGENPFSKYSEYVDAKTGTLNFKNKAILHGGGVEFSSGQTFHISLDEVDRLDELGRGNYGSVYKVRHSRPQLRKPGMGLSGIVSRPEGSKNPRPSDNDLSGAIMAMKEIRLELDESKFAQIIMELDILHRCLSPFIIDFYGAFFQEGAVYICVEYMDGGSIDNVYTNGVPENVLRKVILSTVMGLKSLKDDHNIIHRDVKPTNILVNTRGQIKICDFGVSGNLVASIAKTNIGCQSYMAPERIAGGGVQQSGAPSNGSYSVQSDVWSLGLSVIECAIGRYPYPPETFGNIFNQLHAIVQGDPPGLPDSGFSNEAHAFVKACLDKNPQNRPSYKNLLRHPWLAPLMQRPEGYEFSEDSSHDTDSKATEDREVADWVNERLASRQQGSQEGQEKPALHAVALDTFPGGSFMDNPSSATAPKS